MSDYKQHYVNGAWTTPSGTSEIDVINPADASAIGSIVLADEQDVNQAVQAAKNAFPPFSKTSTEERVKLLESVVEIYTRRSEELAQAVSNEMGAPIELARKAQVPAGLGHIKVALSILKKQSFEEEQRTTQIIHEPVGVCAMITPWNWPLNQITCKVAPAIASGCTMVLKPSEIAPITAHIFAEILDEAGVPAGVFNLIDGDGAVAGNLLSSHPDVDMVSFTGSTRAGKLVSKAAADTVKKVSLELGGKSANIILDDADFSKAISRSVRGVMGNTGQSCNALTRLLVPAERLEEVEKIAAVTAGKIAVGDPASSETAMGPQVSESQWNRVQELIQKGVDEGADLIAGGTGKPDGLESGFYTKPTVFSKVSNDMTIAREEVFGPVVSIIPYNSLEEAVQIANDSDYGLSGGVWSADIEKARAVARQMRTGMVHINGAAPDARAPFGGYKQSGIGREWGAEGFREFQEVKAVMGYNL